MPKQSFRTCRMSLLGGCIDPCDDCPNIEAVKFDDQGEPIKETLCKFDQMDRNCRKVICPVCTAWKPKGTREENIAFCKKFQEGLI